MKRLKYVIIIIVLLGGAWILASILSSQNKDDLRKPVEKKAAEESVIKIKNELQYSVINTSGRMYAFNKVEIFAEVSGVLEESSKRFKAGLRYKKGEVMININSDVNLNSLLAKKSNFLTQISFLIADAKVDFPDSYKKWLSYLDNFDLKKPLLPLPEDLSRRETMYLASHNILSLFYEIKSMEAVYEKFTIEAPFNGVVTQSNINPGTLVRNGQKLGEFINTYLYEMTVPVKAADLHKLSIGKAVELITVNNDKIFKGKIVRINSTVDQQTQSVQVYIQSSDKGILDGMFFNVTINLKSKHKLALIPLQAIHNSNQVRVKTGETNKLVKVTIVEKRVTNYLVKGLEDGSLVIIDKTRY
ncbi:MAG: HlyD family efflux transporter periplasmic adaptor subunit [Bacteroidetes bacterium]|nr:HlyD family efflux transporter periplasmic adaptor subunit [Bacteroidota bacterium]